MLSYELREQVLDYINNRIDFEDLQDWYVPRLRQFLEDPNSADADMIAAIELASVQLAEGLSSEDEVKFMLLDTISERGEPLFINWAKSSMSSDDMRVKTTTDTSSAGEKLSFPRHIQISELNINYS